MVSVSDVDGSKGLATAELAGTAGSTATITASLDGVSGQTTVTVSPAILVSLAVTPITPVVAEGLEVEFQAWGLYSDGSSSDLTPSVNWSSSDEETATVRNAGEHKGTAASLASAPRMAISFRMTTTAWSTSS